MTKDEQLQFTTLRWADPRAKMLAAGITILVVVSAWYAVSRQLGNMLAELTPPSQDNAENVAMMAVALAPNDPATRWLLATKEKEKFNPESIDRATLLFEDVVRRSPNDYRWWIELGRAYEQAERAESAERAFSRAIQLAPAFTFPRWQFGNFFLRQNRTEEAFAELKKETDGSLLYRDQVFSLA